MKTTSILAIALLTLCNISWAQPNYATDETREVVEKMIDAHGGMEAWNNINTLEYSSAMYSESLGVLRFWIKTQVIDMNTRRSYQDWPIVGSKMSFDGDEAWSVDWRVGNPPSHQHSVFFYYVNLPWLTQDSNVNLSQVEKLKHQAFDNEVYKVHMSFTESPILGKSKLDTYTLYIDSKTYLLNGYEYTIGHAGLLDILNIPKDKTVFGPVLRVNNYTGDVNGLKFPMLMTTHSTDMKQLYGDHVMYDYKINAGFDEERMQKPENAVVDTSETERI